MGKRFITAFVVPVIAVFFSLFAFAEKEAVYETRALWAPEGDIDTAEEIDALLQKMKTANLNVLLPCVFCHGEVYFKNSYMKMPAGIEGVFDPLEYMIRRGRAEGIEIHPWFCVTYIGTLDGEGAAHGTMIKLHPEFGVRAPGNKEWGRDKPGDGILYADVHHPGYRDFIVGLMVEMARNYDVDGVHYDYIRAGADSYAPEREAEFRRRFGKPMSEALYDDWTEWNTPPVDDIVSRTTAGVREAGADIIVSAAVFTQIGYVTRQGQDAVKWVKNGWVDLVFTMDYEMSAEMVRLNEMYFKSRIRPEAHGVGLALYQMDGEGKAGSRPPGVVISQMKVLRKLKIDQAAFFASGYLDDNIIKALTEGPYREKAVPVFRKMATGAVKH